MIEGTGCRSHAQPHCSPALNRHRARCTAGALPSATSCIVGLPTPADAACGCGRDGRRRQTFTEAELLASGNSSKSNCSHWRPRAALLSAPVALRWWRGSDVLWDHRRAGRADAGDLYDHLAILCPGVMWRLRWLGKERTRGVCLHLALIPLFADPKIKRTRQDYDRALIRVEMRHDLETSWELAPDDV